MLGIFGKMGMGLWELRAPAASRGLAWRTPPRRRGQLGVPSSLGAGSRQVPEGLLFWLELGGPGGTMVNIAVGKRQGVVRAGAGLDTEH